jgi:hypothetical protein
MLLSILTIEDAAALVVTFGDLELELIIVSFHSELDALTEDAGVCVGVSTGTGTGATTGVAIGAKGTISVPEVETLTGA